jgi:V8-like Glu-specific endopeptidase
MGTNLKCRSANHKYIPHIHETGVFVSGKGNEAILDEYVTNHYDDLKRFWYSSQKQKMFPNGDDYVLSKKEYSDFFVTSKPDLDYRVEAFMTKLYWTFERNVLKRVYTPFLFLFGVMMLPLTGPVYLYKKIKEKIVIPFVFFLRLYDFFTPAANCVGRRARKMAKTVKENTFDVMCNNVRKTLFSITFLTTFVIVVYTSYKWWVRFFMKKRTDEGLGAKDLKTLVVTGFLSFIPFMTEKSKKKHMQNIKDLLFALTMITSSGISLYGMMDKEKLEKLFDKLKNLFHANLRCHSCQKKFQGPLMGGVCVECNEFAFPSTMSVLKGIISCGPEFIWETIKDFVRHLWDHKKEVFYCCSIAALILIAGIFIIAIPIAFYQSGVRFESVDLEARRGKKKGRNNNKKWHKKKIGGVAGKKTIKFGSKTLEEEYYEDENGNIVTVCSFCDEPGHSISDCYEYWDSHETPFVDDYGHRDIGSGMESSSVSKVSTPKISPKSLKKKFKRGEVCTDKKHLTIVCDDCDKIHDARVFCSCKQEGCYKIHEIRESAGVNPAYKMDYRKKQVVIESQNIKGNGFIIKANNSTYVMTAKHVVVDDSKIKAYDGSYLEFVKRDDYPEKDITVFKLKSNNLPGFSCVSTINSSIGICIGYQSFEAKTLKELEFKTCSGVGTVNGAELNYSSVSTEEGSSGSPVLDKDGRVVALHTTGKAQGGAGRLITPSFLNSLN